MSTISDCLNEVLEGRYRIERKLGEGGMATVYLAADLRHERKVAIKVLKPELAAAVGAERFLSEIKTTASLQHPHILPLHDSGEADGYLFYVMPYVEGEALSSRLEREGQLPIDHAVGIARRVAEGLDHAHRHGVIHRDIKPANILLAEGEPLIADFGIAVAVGDVEDQRLTDTGISIGSPYYMSPEQATADGRIGPRSDVFALGCVLYEMLIGVPPFVGGSAQATVLKILTDEVGSISDQRKSVPPNVAAAVSKALEKVPADRFASAEAFAHALADPTFRVPTNSTAAALGLPRRWTAAVIAMAVAAIPLAFMAGRALSSGPDPVLRLGLDLPEGQALVGGTGSRLTIAPDGLSFAYVGEAGGGTSGSRLWIRDLRRQGATVLGGTEGAFSPTFSPDGEWVAFLRDASVWVVNRDGDAPIMLADDFGTDALSLDWGPDGFIYFGGRGVFRVAAGGGEIEQVVPQDEEGRLHFGLRVLPNGEGAIFALGQNETRSENMVAAADFETTELKVLTSGVAAAYSETGHLLIVRSDGQLDVAPFDQNRLEFTGQIRTVGAGIGIGDWGAVDLAISESGTLLYTTGTQEPRRRIAFVDEAGFEKPMEVGWTGPWESVVLSPDEQQLLVGTGFGAVPQLWVRTIDDGQMMRLTIEGDLNRRPVWSDDGKTVTFISQRGEYRAVYRKRADGVGPAEVVLQLPEHVDEADWSPGGEWLVYRTGMSGGDGRDIHAWNVGGDSAHIPIAANPAYDEMSPVLSPDGRWLAYESGVSGTAQLYVRSFPNAADFRTQISLDAGRAPVWSDDGTTLFYREGSGAQGRMVAVILETGSTFSVQGRRDLFPTSPYFIVSTASAFDYRDVDRTFVMIRQDESAAQRDLILIRNFDSDLSHHGSD
jgi:serine/threonine-protein kinase